MSYGVAVMLYKCKKLDALHNAIFLYLSRASAGLAYNFHFQASELEAMDFDRMQFWQKQLEYVSKELKKQ